MILFYNYYFRFNSKQVFECFFFPFALLQNYAYSQVEQCVRFVVGDKKSSRRKTKQFSSYFRFPTSHTTVRAVPHTAVPIFGYHSRYDPIKVAYPAERSLLLSIALFRIGLSAIRQ